MKTILFLFALTVSANAADYAVVINDAEKKALLELLDAAVRSNGLNVAGAAFHLAQKINTAGVVTDQKEQPVEPKEGAPK